MNAILLDTSFLIDYFKGKNKTSEIVYSDTTTTVINYHEILSGVKHRKAKKEEAFFRRFFTEIEVLDFDLKSAEKSSEIMARLLREGKIVNSLDVLISGVALANGIEKIASADKDFDEIAKITGLEILKY